jgi:alkylation response protein AidB-like acyl-CoA dehydrogenase
MYPIYAYGTPEQKEKYLPALAKGKPKTNLYHTFEN